MLISTVAWQCAVQNSGRLISLRFRSVCEDDLVESSRFAGILSKTIRLLNCVYIAYVIGISSSLFE